VPYESNKTQRKHHFWLGQWQIDTEIPDTLLEYININFGAGLCDRCRQPFWCSWQDGDIQQTSNISMLKDSFLNFQSLLELQEFYRCLPLTLPYKTLVTYLLTPWSRILLDKLTDKTLVPTEIRLFT